MWVDGALVFERSHPIEPSTSAEWLDCHLSAGTHRVLVKVSQYPAEKLNSDIALEFCDLDINDGSERLDEYGVNNRWDITRIFRPGLMLRLCDPITEKVFPDVISAFDAPYAPTSAPLALKAFKYRYLQVFKDRLASQPDNLMHVYLYSKACAKLNLHDEAEEYFVKNPLRSTPFGKYLLLSGTTSTIRKTWLKGF